MRNQLLSMLQRIGSSYIEMCTNINSPLIEHTSINLDTMHRPRYVRTWTILYKVTSDMRTSHLIRTLYVCMVWEQKINLLNFQTA